jgi:hypothetical protein
MNTHEAVIAGDKEMEQKACDTSAFCPTTLEELLDLDNEDEETTYYMEDIEN